MLVSVVTPTMNSASFIKQCIGSVLMQESPNVQVEHVIADGGSTDDTVAIAESYGAKVLPGPDDGIFDAANKGTRASSGQLVGFLGADDVLLPGALDAVVRRYQSSGRRWVTGGYSWADEHFRPLGTVAAPPEWITPEILGSLGWCYICHMASYVERSLYDELGGFDLAFPVAADYPFFSEALRRTPFAREPQTLVVFRRHGSNSSIMADHEGEIEAVQERFAPDETWKRELYRAGLKVWANGRNPLWSLRKRVPLPPAGSVDDGMAS